MGENISNDIADTDLGDIAIRINRNEHKRRQAAPVLRISKKAFGMGRRLVRGPSLICSNSRRRWSAPRSYGRECQRQLGRPREPEA